MENEAPRVLNREREILVNSLNQFSVATYNQLMREGYNIFYSPFSIAVSLVMVWAGARGHTQRDIANLLRLVGNPETIHTTLGELYSDLAVLSEGKENKLIIANALWGQKDYKYLPQFLELLKLKYKTELKQIDFAGNPMVASSSINRWVYEITRGEIGSIIRADSLTPLTRLILTNAIYFKGLWTHPFALARTIMLPFKSRGRLFSITRTEVAMMRQTATFGYMEDLDLQVLELPYQGNELSMVIFLPKKVGGLLDFEQCLTFHNLDGWFRQLKPKEIEVFLPRFTFSSEFMLRKSLQLMGFDKVFDLRRADFSGITDEIQIALSDFVHKAFVEVNEEGTEASAVTAVTALEASPDKDPQPPRVFNADHPFFFIIRHKPSGTILFMGRIFDGDKLAKEL